MTLRLYWHDAYLRRFEAQVVQRSTHKGKPAVILDQTAFYPTAGGQPSDRGTINGVPVLEVIEQDDGAILHVIAAPVGGERAVGEVDWARRFDHMQQHSGQHVLSQAFVRIAELDTVAVHIGDDDCTIDLPTPSLDPELLARAEAAANAVVWEDRPIRTYTVSEAEAAALPLRRPPKVRGAIRIVEVSDYDWSACGGTHVRSTAQVGLIKILRAEKRGNETRVTFRCGRRAFEDYVQLHRAVTQLMDRLNAPRYQVDQAVQRLLDERNKTYKALQEAQARLAMCEAADLLEGAIEGKHGKFIMRVLEDRTPDDVRRLARALCEQDRVVAVLGLAGENGYLVLARSAPVEIDMAAQLRQTLAEIFPDGGVKGGGSPTFAQSGGFTITSGQMKQALEPTARRLLALFD